MKHALLLAALTATLAGCASGPKLQQDQAYTLEWIGDRPLMDYSHISLTLGEDGRAYGNAGCNHWFAPYTLKRHHLTFGEVGSTRRTCDPATMEQEQRFLQALVGVQRWSVSKEGQIRLWPDQGKPLRLWPDEG